MKKNILLVEYDSPTIENVKDILSSSIFDISIAVEGDVAKKLIKKKNFDLIICAAMLPKFHGFELSRFTRDTYPDSRIIIISGVYKGLEYRNQALREYGADEFFEKPLNRNTFFETVLQLLEIEQKDFDSKTDAGSTQIPVFDTKKIKTQSADFSKEKEKLSSEDIFGDLIDNVENIPEHNIELNEDVSKDSKETKSGERTVTQANQTTQILSRDTFKEKPESIHSKKEKYDEIKIDRNDFIRPDTEKKERKVEKKIEDDILKKFEETLSGLGIKGPAIKKKPETKTEKPAPEVAVEKISEKIQDASVSKEKEISNEIEGYEILGLIARGGMAEIFKAKKNGVEGFEKILVIKKILSGYGEDNKYIEMFVDEAKIAAELSHPNIVQIYDFGKKDNYHFIAMEYVEGKDLRLILRKLSESKQKLDEHISIYICLKILEALSYAHSAKDKYGNNLEIVHRDISPPNILVSYNGEIKLTDFGVSKASNKLHQTLSGALKGKLLYMSPEQATAEKDIDKRSDIYSVGAILFELLTGEKLFKSSSEMEVLKKVQEGHILQPSDLYPEIDKGLEKIVLKALEKNRKKRYSNAGDMSKDLESYLYKNYNHIPTPIHISVKICNLFKDEIQKDGIRVNLKQVPFNITRIAGSEPTKLIESPEISEQPETLNPDEEIFSDSTNESITEIQDAPEETENQETSDKKTEPLGKNIPDTPIDVSIDEKKIEKYKHEMEDLAPIPDSLSIEKFKKKRLVHPVYILIFIIVAVAAGIYFLSNSFRTENSSPVDKISQNNIKKIDDSSNKSLKISNNKVQIEHQKEPGTGSDIATPKNTVSSLTKDQAGSDKNSDQIKPGSDKAVEKIIEADKLKEAKKKEEEILKKKEKEKKRLASIEKKRKDLEAEKKRIEEETKKKEEEDRLKKIAEEKKLQQEEEDKKRLEEEKKKKLLAEQKRVKPGQILPLSEVDKKPTPISTPFPKIPRSLSTDSSTNVLVSFLIDENGNVVKFKLLKKTDKSNVNKIIQRAILKWKYTPAIKDGVKVKVWRTIPLNIK